MILFESLMVALSTYSALPVPQFRWSERNMKYAICFFPAVGLLCGGAVWLWFAAAIRLHISSFLFAVVAAYLPLLVTGGIHMDGYMDTVDALASHQPRERKLEILKDPGCGAFAVIYCAIYLLVSVGLWHELFVAGRIAVLCPTFVLSRALSGLCAVNLPQAKKQGMLHTYTQNTQKRAATAALAAVLVFSAAAALWLNPISGGLAVLFALLTVLGYRKLTLCQFGGVTGDTSGFFLQLCELACLAGGWIGVLL